jgi:hypothetical protein
VRNPVDDADLARGAYGLDVDLHRHALAENESAGLERLIPRDVEVVAIDLGGGEEACTRVAPGGRLPRIRVVQGARLHLGEISILLHAVLIEQNART